MMNRELEMGKIVSAAYYVGLIRVRDALRWQEYIDLVGATVAQYGGRVLFRGANGQIMAGKQLVGTTPFDRVVTLQFTDEAAARRWHDSPEYQRLVPIRDRGADVVLNLYTG